MSSLTFRLKFGLFAVSEFTSRIFLQILFFFALVIQIFIYLTGLQTITKFMINDQLFFILGVAVNSMLKALPLSITLFRPPSGSKQCPTPFPWSREHTMSSTSKAHLRQPLKHCYFYKMLIFLCYPSLNICRWARLLAFFMSCNNGYHLCKTFFGSTLSVMDFLLI